MRARAPLLGLVSSVLIAGCIASCGTTYKPPRTDNPSKVSKGKFPHELFDKVLKKYNKDGFVDYAGLSKDREDLDRFLEAVSKFSPVNRRDLFPDKDHELAYWINCYNALVFQNVLGKYPKLEKLDEGSYTFFVFDKFTVGGKVLDLKTLEDTYIREPYKEPRVHFALNCASFSCPRLPEEAFTPDELDKQLERETRRFMAEERNVQVDEASGTLTLSKLFDPGWYQEDFIKESFLPEVKAAKTDDEKLIGYINHYRAGDKKIPEREGGWTIVYRDYDWTLNDRKAK